MTFPFHYALADAFTICDAYHCSLLGPTDPNRYHMWTGWVGNDGKNGGPVIDNAELGYDWSTYPERLQQAGISWKIYQDHGAGLDAAHFWGWGEDAYIGNYGDNSLLYFHQYQNAPAGSPLAFGAKTGTNISVSGTLFDEFAGDIKKGILPQVSWIVAPEAYTEHPNWPANYGAWYVSQILDALTANPEVWSKTAFFWLFDENDGFFDHVVPPTPPQSRSEGISTVPTTNEIFTGSAQYPTTTNPAGPYGLGVRVPMIVISPWSKGGYVNSEVFDHTSLIRFIEQRFGAKNPELKEPNITEWRRAVTGDLTSTFNFKNPNDSVAALPSTVAYMPPDDNRHPDYVPAPPADQALPVQEKGTRPARALPYELHANGQASLSENNVRIVFSNSGQAGAVFQVRSGNTQKGPWTYTVTPGKEVSDLWSFAPNEQYILYVFGPNGFYRAIKGHTSGADHANLDVTTHYDREGCSISLNIQNLSLAKNTVNIKEVYSNQRISVDIEPGKSLKKIWHLAGSSGWYDFIITDDSDPIFERRLVGHLETAGTASPTLKSQRSNRSCTVFKRWLGSLSG